MASDRDSTDAGLPQPARLWTVEHANARLEGLRDTLPVLRAWVVRLRRVHDELHRLSAFWGKDLDAADHPDRELKERLTEEWEGLTRRLEEAVAELKSEGIEIKDLDTGLIDFYGLVGGEVVFLCWQRGEPEVAHYHTLTGGFRSRRPLADGRSHPTARAHGSP